MKKQLSGFLFLLVFVASVSAQKDNVAQSQATSQNLQKNITYLASDQLDGRRTGEAGATVAAGYVANQFANLKLKPGVAGKTKGRETSGFLQPFPYFSGVELGTDNLLKIDLPQVAATINLKSNWMPVGSSSNGAIAKTAIVFAGYGIVSEELKFNDYANLDVTGKIVLVFSGTPESGSPHSLFTKFEDIRVKAKIAHDKGAAALLVISGEQKFEDDKLTKLKFDQTLGDTAVPVGVIARPIGAMLLGDKSEAELKQDESFIAVRKEGDRYGVGLTLTGRPQATAELKVDLVRKKADAYNVIGILPGKDPVLKNEAIIVGAHYDHLGRGGSESLAVNSTEIHHGADDNASGTSAIIEIARRFAASKDNKRTIIFMAFSGEEEGLIGSKFYINNPVFPLENTVAMINLDMVGRLREDKLSVGGIGTAEEWNQLVKRRNEIYFDNDNGYGIGRKFNLQLSDDGFGPSDHSSFYGKKIPVLFFFTGSHEDYHKPSDTADKINYEGATNIVYFVSDILRSIDQNAKKPAYAVAKTTPMGGGRSGFSVSLGTVPSYTESTDGLALDGVRDNSPAAAAGVKPGDKIVKLAGREIRNISDYVYVLGEMKAGEEYEIVVMRGTERLTMKIVPVKRN